MFDVSFLVIRVWCRGRCDNALVGRFLDEDKCEDQESACKGELDIEVESGGLVSGTETSL